MRRVQLPLLLAAMAVLTACGTNVKVSGTYQQVWDATSSAVRDEASMRSGRAMPTPAGRATGRVRTSIIDVSANAEMDFFAEIKPVGGDESKPHTISLFVYLDTPDATDTEVRATRRRDVEKDLVASIRRRLGLASLSREVTPDEPQD